MVYLKTMDDQQTGLAQAGTLLGIVFAILAVAWKWISESFRTQREETAAKIKDRQDERKTAIREAVKEGMQEFADKIEDKVHLQLKEYSEENNKRFIEVNKRIDDALMGKK